MNGGQDATGALSIAEAHAEISLVVIDSDGEHLVKAYSGETLLSALQADDIPIGAVCGGGMICGTCHVFLSRQGTDVSQDRSADEMIVLEDLRLFDAERSRLACQVTVSAALVNWRIEIAPDD